ncbi:MAG: hypothetical protein IT328_23770 [Caldilineaceae bacterium]|nr:hypothetical protein [Caldilineaceae bacterium]
MPSFESAWLQPEFEVPDSKSDFCVYAERFNIFVQELLSDLPKNPSEIYINIAKLHLLDRYFAFYVSVPLQHRRNMGPRGGHTCLFQVFEQGYSALRLLELSAAPPKILLPSPPPPSPPPPPPPTVPEFRAITLGEVLDEG